MNIVKSLRTTVIIGTIAISAAFLSGCGGVSEAQMAELEALRSEVKSLESEANTLKQERAELERELQEKNRKLAECEQQKEETRANLNKLPQ